MKLYHGRRSEYGCAVDVEEDGETSLLHPRLDLKNLAPLGLDWGYSGSASAQLALALAADVLGDDDRALAVYRNLQYRLVGSLPSEGWTVTESRIRSAIDAIEQEHSRSRT